MSSDFGQGIGAASHEFQSAMGSKPMKIYDQLDDLQGKEESAFESLDGKFHNSSQRRTQMFNTQTDAFIN